MEELSSILVNCHPECMILHEKFQKFSGGYTPEPPWREGATPFLHPPPANNILFINCDIISIKLKWIAS